MSRDVHASKHFPNSLRVLPRSFEYDSSDEPAPFSSLFGARCPFRFASETRGFRLSLSQPVEIMRVRWDSLRGFVCYQGLAGGWGWGAPRPLRRPAASRAAANALPRRRRYSDRASGKEHATTPDRQKLYLKIRKTQAFAERAPHGAEWGWRWVPSDLMANDAKPRPARLVKKRVIGDLVVAAPRSKRR